jgi:hypothetical protein
VPAIVTALVEQAGGSGGENPPPCLSQRITSHTYSLQESKEGSHPPCAAHPRSGPSVSDGPQIDVGDAGVFVTVAAKGEGEEGPGGRNTKTLKAERLSHGVHGMEPSCGHLVDQCAGETGRGRVGEGEGSHVGPGRVNAERVDCGDYSSDRDSMKTIHPQAGGGGTPLRGRPHVVNDGDVRAEAATGISSGAVRLYFPTVVPRCSPDAWILYFAQCESCHHFWWGTSLLSPSLVHI